MASNPPPGTIAAGYIRRSFASTNSPGDASRTVQEQAVRALGGPNVVLYDADFGVSGNGANTHRRKDYLRLKEDIAKGIVGSVSAYSLSRLGRSAKEVFEFADLCQKHGVVLATSVESLDTSSATGRMMFQMLSVLAEFESNLARERTVAALAVRKAKGQPHGSAPYGFVHREVNGKWQTIATGEADQVVSAYRQHGSFYGTARALTAQGVPTPTGRGKHWTPTSVQRVILHAAPELLPTSPSASTKRRKATGDPLSRLVLCWCGRVMTPASPRVGLYCSDGRQDPSHGKAWIGEAQRAALLDAIKVEADKYAPPKAVIATKNATVKDRTRLEAKRARLVDALADGILTKAEATQRIAQVDEELSVNARKESSLESVTIPSTGVDWSDPDKVGEQLRTMFVNVQLDRSYKHITVTWAVPDAYHDKAARQALEAEEAQAVAAYESEAQA